MDQNKAKWEDVVKYALHNQDAIPILVEQTKQPCATSAANGYAHLIHNARHFASQKSHQLTLLYLLNTLFSQSN